MKKCPYCRKENQDDDEFCVECKTKLPDYISSSHDESETILPLPATPTETHARMGFKLNSIATVSIALAFFSPFYIWFIAGLFGIHTVNNAVVMLAFIAPITGIIAIVQIVKNDEFQKGIDRAIIAIMYSIVVAMVLSIIIPELMGSSLKAKDSTLRANLVTIQKAIDRYHTDCGGYPADLADLVTMPSGLPANTWKGPYLDAQGGIGGGAIPRNPYVKPNSAVKAQWTYNPINGKITFPEPKGEDANGEAYSGW